MKEDINEISSKTCYDIVQNIKPKEFSFVGKKDVEVGFIAEDWGSLGMKKDWSHLVWNGKDDCMRMDYTETNVISWSAIQEMIGEIGDLKKEITKLKQEGESHNSEKEKPKARAKAKSKGRG